MGVEFGSTGGYLWLDSWVMANIIYLSTQSFCSRFLNMHNDPCGRAYDQMVMAARSIPANIAEGTSRHQTSCETELRLLDVARGSISELANDYLNYLMSHKCAAWSRESEDWKAVHNVTLDRAHYSDDLMHDVTVHIMAQKSKFDFWVESDDFYKSANAMVVLCGRLIRMLQRQIAAVHEQFKQKGGFTENLTQDRKETLQTQAIEQGNPTCPCCGKPMVKRTIKKGMRQGQEFWGCSDYPRCTATRPT